MFREANLSSTLLPEEVNHDVNAKTHIEVRKRIASRAMRERAQDRSNIKLKSSYPKRTELAKSVLYVDAGVRMPETWGAQLASLEARATLCAYEATIFVVVDHWHPHDELMFCSAALRGAWVGTPALLDESPPGPCRKLRVGAATRRQLYVTEQFRRQHTLMWACIPEVLLRCPKTTGVSWRLLKHGLLRRHRRNLVTSQLKWCA